MGYKYISPKKLQFAAYGQFVFVFTILTWPSLVVLVEISVCFGWYSDNWSKESSKIKGYRYSM